MVTTVRSFLTHAVQLEREAARRYEELSAAMGTEGNRELKEFFGRMAHYSRLHLADAVARGGFRELPTLAPHEFEWPDGVSPETAGWAGVDAQMSALDALYLALSLIHIYLAYADVIVSGGKGLKNADNFKLVWDLARVLGAEVGATRAVTQAGWAEAEQMCIRDSIKALSSAEDFLNFFGLPFDERVVQVNRLHILKRFFQHLRKSEGLDAADEVEQFRRYRLLLAQAYQDFVVSTPAREKVFKVFQDAGGTQHVQLAGLRNSLSLIHISPGPWTTRKTPWPRPSASSGVRWPTCRPRRCPMPVSYTHLDVYKRQKQRCSRT